MKEVFKDYPSNWSLVSIMLGVFAITMFGFGYLELSKWMGEYSQVVSLVMYISAVITKLREVME